MTKNGNMFLYLLISIFGVSNSQNSEWLKNTDTLVATHVIFRHGSRTPDRYCFKTFNITKDYWPDGIGQLTQKGKMEEFLVGVALREKYDKFLGDTYYPNLIGARSTDYDRTKASLLLCLAGLFPPTKSQQWHDNLLWQPIPIEYKPVEDDLLLRYPTHCNNYRSAYIEQAKSPRVQLILQAKQNLIEYVRSNFVDRSDLALIISSPIEELYFTYFCLVTMEDTNVPIPSWAKPIYPDILSQMAVLEYHLKAIEDTLIQYTGGYILTKILKDTEDYIAGRNVENLKKMYLYSGHEFNVALTLLAIDSFPPKVPSYGSFMVIEHHKINGEHGFKVFYQNYEELLPILITIPGCDSFCTITQFKDIMATRLAPPNIKCD